MRYGALLVCCLGWVSPVFACDVSIGDWKLAKGDVILVEIRDAGSGKVAVSVEFSGVAGQKMTEVSSRYLNKKMPVHIGSYSSGPVVRMPIHGNEMMFDGTTVKEAKSIKTTLEGCI